jgi:uncharacterized MAPEG superfamily protein
MSTLNTPYNWSVHAIPAAYCLAFPPYLYQFAKSMTASKYTATNIVPRTNLESLKGKLDTNTWQKLARARGAHLNALEGFPLFAAAMVSYTPEFGTVTSTLMSFDRLQAIMPIWTPKR